MSEKPFIVCFDAATAVGVCDGTIGGTPRMWTWNLKDGGETRPDRLLHLSRLLGTYLRQYKADAAFIEAPLPIAIMVKIGATDDTVQMLRGVVAIIEVCSARADVPIAWWNVQDARQSVTGKRTFKKGTAKREVMKYCAMLGYHPTSDNEADALIGFLYQSALLNPRLAAAYTPLFGGEHAR